MAENDKIIKQELERAGSLENLFEEIVRSEPKELRERQQQIEIGPDHPDQSLLRNYACGRVSDKEDDEITEHIALCSKCAEVVLDMQYLEAIRSESTESLVSRIKNFISSLSFPVFVQFPALEPVRGTVTEAEVRSYAPGEEIILTFEAPGDGHVSIFYGCEETGEIRLVYPLESEDDSQVRANQLLTPIKGAVEGPAGKHFFTVFWTRTNLLNPEGLNLQDEHVCDAAIEHFFEELKKLDEDDWASTTTEYEVLAE